MKREIIVILDNVRSALNVGAILRTCDGAGVKKVYLSGITPDQNHPKVKKTALGAEKYVDIEKIDDFLEFSNKIKADGFELISVEQAKESKDFRKVETKDKIALVFGNEITGIPPYILQESDRIIEIPMLGKKNSLNVATTLGIIVYYFSLIK